MLDERSVCGNTPTESRGTAMRRHHSTRIQFAGPSLLDEAFAEATAFIAELFMDAVHCRATAAQFLWAEDLLAALPLPTHEFAMATQRLDNALDYYHAAEIGGCMYELWLLVRRLRNRHGAIAS
jgi:hypothetical protein